MDRDDDLTTRRAVINSYSTVADLAPRKMPPQGAKTTQEPGSPLQEMPFTAPLAPLAFRSLAQTSTADKGGSATQQDTQPAQNYLLKVCRALIMYGAPAHRLETYASSTAEALGLQIQTFSLPGCMFVAFSDQPSGVHIIRSSSCLDLVKLHDTHTVYKSAIHRKISPVEADARLEAIASRKGKYHLWLRILAYGLGSAFFGPLSYNARPIDLPFIFILGCCVGFLELLVAPRSELYGYIFETSAAILASFIGRALGTIALGHGRDFCFSAISQASIVMILPGFTIANSALELQSKNIVSGAVRMVYGIIYTLFLAFGFILGITIYGAIDPRATSALQCTQPWPFWWQIAFVVPFTVCYMIVYQGELAQTPATSLVTLAGWVVNYFASQRFGSVRSIPQALGALTVGLLANLHSRLGLGLAVVLMYPAIFVQVPGSLAASGGLTGGVAIADKINNRLGSNNGTSTLPAIDTNALTAGYAMVEIAIGITVGLSVSALLVYPFRKPRGKSGLFSL